MGIIIISIAALVEIVFGIYCIATQSNQKRIRSWIRISAFATFVILILLSVIQWSFRWILLGVILFIWTIIGVVSLIRKKGDKKKYKIISIVIKAITTWLIVFIAVIPALIFSRYELPKVTGDYEVNTVVYTYIDNSRIETFNDTGENRKVTVDFWYPSDADGRYPLVVFSHGAFGVSASNTSTFIDLASNGYIVCSISHHYHSMYTLDTDGNITIGDRSFRQEVIDVNNNVYDNEEVYKLEQKWMKLRIEDMHCVINTIIQQVEDNDSDRIYQLIDTGKIGLFGHSLGGAVGVQLGRERDDIDGVINLDGDLLGECVGFVDGKYVINEEIYPIPILNIYTDDMKELYANIRDKDFVIAKDLILATAPEVHEIYISGTNHMSLTDLPLVSPFLVEMLSSSTEKMGGRQEADKYYVIEKMNSIILEFFDYYLKDQGSFRYEGTY